MLRTLLLSYLLLILSINLLAQTDSVKRHLPAVRATHTIAIDGVLNDSDWITAPVADHFVEREPFFKRAERYENRTEIRVLYDDDAIYVGGYCHEAKKDSLSGELVGRDVIGSNDFLGVIFDTYNDKINGFGYYVTPLGEQFDAKYSSTGEDPSWNSVYKSVAKIVEDGWTFEMRIPYSAIRFSNTKTQDWGLNFFRKRKKAGENLTWNPIDETKHFFSQFGLWTGIKNIKLPIRLSFSPYLSTDVSNYPYNTAGVPNTSTHFNGGMDVKYGINQAFTMDMTLVPDFGQVQSDNKILNITPFEVKYNEYRTFFTEGTELFSKGDIFYSRRIGGTPIHHGDIQLNTGDTIIDNPTESKLINATKVSGRTADGLGIGFLNAITKAQYATIQDSNHHQYKVQTNPLTNYNIVVFDKSLKNNSSISLINTNVSRNSRDYNANVTDGLWDLYFDSSKWNFSGKFGVSQLYGDTNYTTTNRGVNYSLNFGKVSGQYNYSISEDYADNRYTHQDMGYYTNNNFFDHTLFFGYKQLKPHYFYNNIYSHFVLYYSQRYTPRSYQSVNFNADVQGQFKTLGYYYVNANYHAKQHDYYEPRTDGYVFIRPASWLLGAYLSSNDAKKFSASVGLFHRTFVSYGSKSTEIDLGTQYRFNKKLSANISTTLNFNNKSLGYATNVNDSVIFALRKINTVENIYNAKYNFTNRMGANIRIRHYWSRLANQNYFNLSKDGGLTSVDGISVNADDNVNYFNVDFVYTWEFVSGSFLTFTWKNAISTEDNLITDNYPKNLHNTIYSNELNTVSLKVIYFLDYLSIKKKHH